MAVISGNTEEKVFSIKKFLGLNESIDGDTKLQLGEASLMNNFRVTRDGNLQKRPGTLTLFDFFEDSEDARTEVKALWEGDVNSVRVLLTACNGKLYNLYSTTGEFLKTEIGSADTTGNVHIFGFGGKAYILTRTEYKAWDGTTLSTVEGYVPLVTVSVPPAGGGDEMENINRLTGKRRCWFSPDGTATAFQLPEKNIYAIIHVKNNVTGAVIPSTDYTSDLQNGVITFNDAPQEAVNSIEVCWDVNTSYRNQIYAMRFSELFNSTQDTRVFLYGDGSNRAIYSGIDYDGTPRADYFPDLYEISVGDGNTAITGLIRHYSRLICFKESSTYSIVYGEVSLADGNLISAFYATPINKTIGMLPYGQACLVLNTPRTLFGNDLYEWRNNNSYGANLTIDERQARRISDRINDSLGDFNTRLAKCFDDNFNQEYWIYYGNTALVHNYVSDAWFKYTNLDIACMCSLDGKLVFGTSDGKIKHLDYAYKSDDGTAIRAEWESGSMSFGKDYMRKYSSKVWISLSREKKSKINCIVKTDRDLSSQTETIEEEFVSFDDVDFANFVFEFNTSSVMHRMKLKAKKFIYYKLCLNTNDSDTAATVTAVDVLVRYSGYAK